MVAVYFCKCRQLHDSHVTLLTLQKERKYLNVYALFIYFFFFPLILKSFLGLLLKKSIREARRSRTPVSLPFFSFFLSFFRDSEAFDNGDFVREKYRRSICFPFPTLENRAKIDVSTMGPVRSTRKICRICNHVEEETRDGGEGNSLAKIFRTPLVRTLISLLFIIL